jgi:hypothetical protein
MAAQDFKLDTDGDIYINASTGDFDVVESDGQHVQDIFDSVPGWWKEFPLLGVNMIKYLNSTGKQVEIQGKGKEQLQADGYVNVEVTAEQQEDGTYKVGYNAERV